LEELVKQAAGAVGSWQSAGAVSSQQEQWQSLFACWPQSGQMFIAQVQAFIPRSKERNEIFVFSPPL
jgi:hypothetical protein